MERTNLSSTKSVHDLRDVQLKLFAKYFPEDGLGKRPFSLTIHRKTVAEVFQFLKNLEDLQFFFERLEKVTIKNETDADWYFADDSGKLISVPMVYDLNEQASSLVWKAETSVGFDYSLGIFLEPAPAGRGTIVRMLVAYDNFAGKFGGLFEFLFGKDAMVTSKKNLYRMKAYLETGSVPTTEGQPSGRREDKPDSMKH